MKCKIGQEESGDAEIAESGRDWSRRYRVGGITSYYYLRYILLTSSIILYLFLSIEQIRYL